MILNQPKGRLLTVIVVDGHSRVRGLPIGVVCDRSIRISRNLSNTLCIFLLASDLVGCLLLLRDVKGNFPVTLEHPGTNDFAGRGSIRPRCALLQQHRKKHHAKDGECHCKGRGLNFSISAHLICRSCQSQLFCSILAFWTSIGTSWNLTRHLV